MNRWWLVILFLGVGGWLGAQSTAVAPSLEVRVQQGACVEELVYSGEIEACRKVDIHVPEFLKTRFCTVKFVPVDGTRVKEGDLIVEFDDADFQAALAAARDKRPLAKAE